MLVQLFSNIPKNANRTYESAAVKVSDTAKSVSFSIDDIDLVNEPSTTVFQWRIEKSNDNGATWDHLVSSEMRGLDGVQPHKPMGNITIDARPIRGKYVRTVFSYTSSGQTKKQFSLSLNLT